MRNNWKIWLCAVMFIGAFIAGRITTKPVVVEKVVEVEKVIEVVKNKVRDRTITTTKKDGTTIVVTDKTKEGTVKSENLTQKVNETVAKKNRRVSVKVVAPLRIDLNQQNLDYEVGLGMRVYKDLWIEGGYQIKSKSVLLGIGVEF